MKQTGTVRVFLGNVLELLAMVYPSVFEAQAQPIENSADAGATQIWLVLDPDKITVIDNGRGMVDEMASEDAQRLDEAIERLEKFREPFNVDQIVPVGSWSRYSLEWVRSCIGLSSKSPGQTAVRGMKGIGFLAYLMYADGAKVITRPVQELADRYWSHDKEMALENPSFLMTAPSRIGQSKMVDVNFDTDFSVGMPLQDPWEKEMEHGTRIEYFPLHKGVIESLRVNSLLAFLRGRFGQDIREGKYRITIVDKLRSEAQVIEVTPPEYKGVMLIDEEGEYRGVKFKVFVTYDPRAKGPILVRHKKSDKFPLTSLAEFQRLPWNNPRLGGYVDFPALSNEDQLWDTGKSRLMDTPDTRNWINAVLHFSTVINRRLQELEDHLKDEALHSLGVSLANATNEALSQVDVFQDLTVSVSEVDTTKRRKKKMGPPVGPRRIRPEVLATVLDEYRQGVQGVVVELWHRNGKLVVKKFTGISGSVSFGEQPNGLYTLTLITPEGMSSEPGVRTSVNFGIGQPDTKRRFRAIFRIVTGKAKPIEQDALDKVELLFTPLDDPECPYVQRLQSGKILINSTHQDLVDAWEDHDLQRQRALYSQY